MIRRWLVAVALLVLGAVDGYAQTVESNGLKLKLGGRAQIQYSTTSIDEAELRAAGVDPSVPIAASMFETRRIRLAAELEYQEWLTGKIEGEFGMARLQMRDVWMNLEIDPAFQFKVGQFKKPFSWLQLTSSSKWPLIERGIRQRGIFDAYEAADVNGVLSTFRGRPVLGEEQDLLDLFSYQNFDLGAVVWGGIDRFGYTIGVFNGPGSDAIDDTDGKSIVGRATAKVMETYPLTVGAGFSTRELRVSSTPTIETRDGVAFEVDFELGDFRRKGLHLFGEVTSGRNLAIADGVGNENFLAAQAIAAWFAPIENARVEGWELAGRLSWGDPRRGIEDDEAMLLTPGVNLYFSGRNRIMLNWDVLIPTGSAFSTEHVVRAQAQVYF